MVLTNSEWFRWVFFDGDLSGWDAVFAGVRAFSIGWAVTLLLALRSLSKRLVQQHQKMVLRGLAILTAATIYTDIATMGLPASPRLPLVIAGLIMTTVGIRRSNAYLDAQEARRASAHWRS